MIDMNDMLNQLPYKKAKRMLLDSFERLYFAELMRKHDGNLSAASRQAELSRRHLRSLLRRYDLYTPPVNDDRRQFLTQVSGALLAVPVVAAGLSACAAEEDHGLPEWDPNAPPPVPPGGGGDTVAQSFMAHNEDSSGHSHTFEVKCSHRGANGWVYTAGGAHTHTVELSAADLDAVFAGSAVTIDTTDGHPHTWVVRLPDGVCW